ncbi:DUF1810 domain-containing protein [Rhizobium sp. SL42]|uniref:DUF1810 domain-containing protein n=1 Tax=Rhizobium sp. SL42 TaxID=2806346 RepID=UPI001F35C9BA|nr:DUF1810 domain-containing protein [Rhizobium sp. SL42]UJW74998.1 DUF1810 domain-containing protein [Rhizobium sp. SL42]
MGDAKMFDSTRFLEAQAPVLEAVKAELGAGRKQSHWMWFVFPQLRGLGLSPTSLHYGLASVAEAQSYLADDQLGPRLVDCTRLVMSIEGRSLHEIFGSPDDRKFQSCMTLFSLAAPDERGSIFRQALDRYCGGRLDHRTLEILSL